MAARDFGERKRGFLGMTSLEEVKTSRPEVKPEFLIEEYKLCHDYATHMNSITWQMAAVLFPVSLAGLAFMFSISSNPGLLRLMLVVVVSSISITTLWAWLQLFMRWFSYEQIAFYRMAEIEEELGLWLVRYGEALRKAEHTLTKERYKRLTVKFAQFPRKGTREIVRLVVSVLIAGWVILSAFEFLRTALVLF
jgi:hypothetical protein